MFKHALILQLKFGAIVPEALLQQAFQHSVSTMVLADINSTSVDLGFVGMADKYEIK